MDRNEPGRGEARASDFDVLIVGGGPTGLMAGCQLLRRGIRVRIIDRAPEPTQFPKALTLWPRSQELLEDLGLADGVRAASCRINAFSYFSERRPLASFRFSEEHAPVSIPQVDTERLLGERLNELGGKIERGVGLLSLEGLDFSGRIDGSKPVTAVLEHADGRIERVAAPYVIGADGAGSTVRGQLGVGFHGETYETAFALIDTKIEGKLPNDEVLYYQSPKGALVVVAMPDDVFRFLSVMPPTGQAVDVPMMQAIIDERGPRGVKITEPVWKTIFRVHARHATAFQLGRVFLLGDSAHVHSPAGGQGLNTALQDALNLGWKLAAVIRGESPSDLLLSYGPERSAVAAKVVRDTDIQTKAWLVNTPAKLIARDAAFRLADISGAADRLYTPVLAGRALAYPPVRESQQPAGFSTCKLRAKVPGGLKVGMVLPRALALPFDISGPDAEPSTWTITVVAPDGETGADWLTEIGHIADRHARLRIVRISRAQAARHTGCSRPGYYLVRPDSHIAAHGHQGDLARLEAELAVSLIS